jgi:hypothetical protein
MSIEMPAQEVYALADRLKASAEEADETGDRLGDPVDVGGPLQPAVESFLDCHREAARAIAGELRWLGSTIASVAEAWLRLDGSLRVPRGRGRLE